MIQRATANPRYSPRTALPIRRTNVLIRVRFLDIRLSFSKFAYQLEREDIDVRRIHKSDMNNQVKKTVNLMSEFLKPPNSDQFFKNLSI